MTKDQIARQKYEAYCQSIGVKPAAEAEWNRVTKQVADLNRNGNTGDRSRPQPLDATRIGGKSGVVNVVYSSD